MAVDDDAQRAIISGILLAAECLLDSDVEEIKECVINEIRIPMVATALSTCVTRPITQAIEDFTAEEFRSYFRVSKHVYLTVCDKLHMCPNILPKNSKGGRQPVPIEKQVQMTLWLLQNTEPIHSVATRFNVAQSTVVRVTKKVCDHIIKYLYQEYIVWPTGCDREHVKLRFHQISGLLGIVGVIDSSHFQVKAHFDSSKMLKNNREQSAVILQGVCTDDLKFIDLYCNSPGRFSDAQVLMNSPLYVNGHQLCGNDHLIGDSSYPLLPWLMTPYEDNGYLTQQQLQYNFAVTTACSTVQRTFAALKGRFRRLKFIDMKDVGDISKLILAACVLHNVCISHGDNPAEFIGSAEDHDSEWHAMTEVDLNGVYKRDRVANEVTNPGFGTQQTFSLGQYS